MIDEQVYVYAEMQTQSWHPNVVRVSVYQGEDIQLINFFIGPNQGNLWIAPPEMSIVLTDLIPKVEIEPDVKHDVRSMKYPPSERLPNLDRYVLCIFVDYPGDIDEMLGE